MKFKENWKRFWTLSRRHDGFTLVELIVVIAIMAVLVGVGVPAYTGYIEKSNMVADQTLISEVAHAVRLAVMNDYEHDISGTAIVKLSTEGASITNGAAEDQAILTEAMKASFGDNWAEDCKLKYDGWTGGAAAVVEKYDNSSFKGNEAALLDKVGSLTGAMGEFFASGKTVPTQIEEILKEQGIDTTNSTAVANGAVAALADSISSADPAVQQKITEALVGMPSAMGATGDLTNTVEALNAAYSEIYKSGNVTNDAKMAVLATTATLYAYAEAYSQYASNAGYTAPADTLAAIKFTNDDGSYKSSDDILETVQTAFQTIVVDSMTPGSAGNTLASNYFNAEDAQGPKDADAFISIMGALSESSNELKQNLTSDTFYTDGTAASLLNGYLEVGRAEIAAGEGAVIVNPDRTVTAYLGGMIG